MFKRRAPSAHSSMVRTAAGCCLLLLLSASHAAGHGVVGNRIFLSPIVGNDAFPDNALGLSSRRSDFDFSLLPSFEKLLSDNSSVLIEGGWEQLEPGAKPDVSGARDLSIYFRQAAYISVPHELEFTVSPFLVVPTGSRKIGDQGFTHLGAELLLGKGMGDLPDSPAFGYLRAFALQAEFGYAGRIQGRSNSDLVGNFEIEYSLRYLDRVVRATGLATPWLDLVPYAQFNYSHALTASHLTTRPDFRLTPGLAYLDDYCELSLGTQVGLNDAPQHGDRVAVIGTVEIFYDDIFPALGWKPF